MRDPVCLFVQNGDFREALNRFSEGGTETYLDQRRSVEFVRHAASERKIAVAYPSDAPHDERIGEGLRLIGLPRDSFWSQGMAPDLIDRVRPDMAVVRTPHFGMLGALSALRVPVLACFADVFAPVAPRELLSRTGLARYAFNRRIRRCLRDASVTAVANHSLGASVSVREVLGIAPERIIPWEWTRLEAETGPLPDRSGGPLSLVYAGALTEAKGVGDLLRAVGLLASDGQPVALRLFGDGGERPALTALSEDLGLGGSVTFEGRAPNPTVREAMRAADAVVVPSRHAYAEGLPNVIFEALSVRTALIITDHPAYVRRFTESRDCLIVPEREPYQLARALGRLAREPETVRDLRERAGRTLDSLYVGQSWYAVIQRFFDDPRNREGWVAPWSLAALDK